MLLSRFLVPTVALVGVMGGISTFWGMVRPVSKNPKFAARECSAQWQTLASNEEELDYLARREARRDEK